MSKKCTCIQCSACRGSGQIWFSCTGDYLGDNRCDDMDELEPCDFCNGSGVDDWCDYCYEQEEIYQQEQEELEQQECCCRYN